jgi:hypothetical protein
MSTTLANPAASSVPKKVKSKKRDTASSMTYAEAVRLLRACDDEIRNASCIRTYPQVKLRHDLRFHTLLKTGTTVAATDATLMALIPADSMTGGIVLLMAAGTFLLPALSTKLPQSVLRVLSPFKSKQEATQRALAKSFYNLKEDHFEELETAIRQKAKPAISIINERIKDQGQRIVCKRNSTYENPHFGVETTISKGYTATEPIQQIADMNPTALSRQADVLRKLASQPLTA